MPTVNVTLTAENTANSAALWMNESQNYKSQSQEFLKALQESTKKTEEQITPVDLVGNSVSKTSEVQKDNTEDSNSSEIDPKDQETMKETDTQKEVNNEKEDTEITDDASLKESLTDEDEVNETMEDISNFMAQIAEVLGISVNELSDLMEKNGITAADLLEETGLSKLYMAANEDVSTLDFLTDESLMQGLTETVEELSNCVESFLNETGLDLEEAERILSAFDEKSAFLSDMEENAGKDLKEIVSLTKPEDLKNMMETENSETAIDGDTEEGEIQTLNHQENAAGDATEENQGNESKDLKQEQLPATDQSDTANHTTVFKVNNQSATVETALEPEMEIPEPQELLKQFADYVKVNANSQMTEMEMQLNPENLGTMNLQIASKEGVITAHITVQNEVVKEALENQMIQMKETLNQQGLKVNSVEVSVAEYALDENTGKDQQKDNESQKSKKNLRRLNLTEENLDEISEEDKIVVDMMTQNGNTVDYAV